MLQLRMDGFWGRWFFRSLAIWEKFAYTEHSREPNYRRSGTNLCQFCRMIFLWTPLAIVVNLAGWAAVIAVTMVFPIRWFGGGYGWFWFWVLLGAGVITGIVWLTRHPWKVAVHVQPHPAIQDAARLTRAFILAQKRHFCPFIKFTEVE